MGLDIAIHETDISRRLRSYSSVHYLRKILIVFTIRYIRKKHKTEAKRVVRLLKKWLQKSGDKFDHITYDAITPDCPDVLNECQLAGLYWFVNHSDFDGSWSIGQCYDIALWLGTLLCASYDGLWMLDPYYKSTDFIEMQELFMKAFDMRKPVICK